MTSILTKQLSGAAKTAFMETARQRADAINNVLITAMEGGVDSADIDVRAEDRETLEPREIARAVVEVKGEPFIHVSTYMDRSGNGDVRVRFAEENG